MLTMIIRTVDAPMLSKEMKGMFQSP